MTPEQALDNGYIKTSLGIASPLCLAVQYLISARLCEVSFMSSEGMKELSIKIC